MIFTEDGAFVFEKGFDTAVPFMMRESIGVDAPVDYEIYEELLNFTEDFSVKFKGREFSEEALDAIWSVLLPYASERGYRPPAKKHRCCYFRYIFDESCELRSSRIQPETKIVSAEEALKYKNLTTFDFTPELSAGDSAITLINGEIASVCAINLSSEDPAFPELCVETAPAMRGRGCAVSNICAMAGELRKNGLGAEYRCSQKNHASAAAAISAGFRPAGRIYYFVCYKKEKINGI